MGDKKTILILTSHFSPNVGGVETHLSDLVAALKNRRWKVVIATYRPLARSVSSKIYESSKGLKIYRMPWVGFNIVHKLTQHPLLEFIYLFPGLFVVTGIALFLNPEISVIHAQGLVPAVVALILARITGKRVIMSTHNLYFFPKTGIYTKFSSFVLSRVDMTLVLSDQSGQEILNIGVPMSKVQPFRYWLNLNLFKPMNKQKVLRLLDLRGKFVCFFVGRLIETKGVLILLKSAQKLKNITFIFAGVGPLSEEIEKASSEFKNIQYIGPVSPEVVRNYMSVSDIVAVPSLVDEGYGRVAMESIATGTPVLAAKKGGLSEVVNEKVGKLIEPTVREYTRWLRFFYNHPDKLRKYSKNARSYALAMFSEKNVESIIEQYTKKT